MNLKAILVSILGLLIGVLIISLWQSYQTTIDFLIVFITGYYLVTLSFLNLIRIFIIKLSGNIKLNSIINKVCSVIIVFSLASIIMLITTIIPNSVNTTYSDILGCEVSCNVAASGYPLPFIADYPGLSPANSADFLGVLYGWDKIILEVLHCLFVILVYYHFL